MTRRSGCTCQPGARCTPCRHRGHAHYRMLRLARLYPSDVRTDTDRVAYADQRTSLNDARTALCAAMGVPLDRIDPATGHNLTHHQETTP